MLVPTTGRSELTAEQRRAIELRAAYSKPPGQWPPPTIDPKVKWAELGPLPEVAFPADNRYSAEKAELGRQLFFDSRLSAHRGLACASCHKPEHGWADGRKTSFGSHPGVVGRHTPGLLNVGLLPRLYWDGRAGSLEEQVRTSLLEPTEMDSTEKSVIRRLEAVPQYGKKFRRVFGTEKITLRAVSRAIATFERTLRGGQSEFDLFFKGDTLALSDEALFGLHLFRTKARCMNCHHGPNLTDNRFHDVGLSYYDRKLEDLGRYFVTRKRADAGRFKTPSLRNVARTAPYMHNGRFQLNGTLRMFNAGMPKLRRKDHQHDDPLFPTKSPLLRPLNLAPGELEHLKAFLESLSEPHAHLVK